MCFAVGGFIVFCCGLVYCVFSWGAVFPRCRLLCQRGADTELLCVRIYMIVCV